MFVKKKNNIDYQQSFSIRELQTLSWIQFKVYKNKTACTNFINYQTNNKDIKHLTRSHGQVNTFV